MLIKTLKEPAHVPGAFQCQFLNKFHHLCQSEFLGETIVFHEIGEMPAHCSGAKLGALKHEL